MDTITPPPVSPTSFPGLPRPDGNDKLWAIGCHLAGFIGAPLLVPFIIYLVMRNESAFVRDHAREALNFHLSLIFYGILCWPFIFIIIGFPMLIALGVFAFVVAIIAAIKTSDGVAYRYPLCIRLIS
jgi:uncharacterized Tic20 family protein